MSDSSDITFVNVFSQGLMKKHEVFEADLQHHNARCMEIENEGENLIVAENMYSEDIAGRCRLLKEKLEMLGTQAEQRRAKLTDHSAFLQFMWKCDVVDSWIGELLHSALLSYLSFT